MTDNTEALPPHPSHATVRDWMPVAEALRLADLWTVGDLDNSGQWRAAIKVLADEVRAALAQRQQVPTTAWLVEWRFNGVQWLYLWPSAPGGFSFTSDASKALRFARREDAEAALQWARDTDAARRPIGSLTRHGLALGEMLVTEHDWPALTAAPSAQAEPVAWQWRRLLGNPDVIEPFWTEREFCSESQYQYALAMPDHEARALCEAALPAPRAARAEPKPCGQCRKADSWGIPLSKTCVYDCKLEPLNAAPPTAQAEPNADLRADFERECADTDKLLTALGLSPEHCRTDGGSLKLGIILEALEARDCLIRQEAALAAPSAQAEIPDLRCAKWLDPECADAGACQSLKFKAAPSAQAEPQMVAPQDGMQFWLWKNGDHFLAFTHLYPCFTPGGDPMVLGEPVGRAVFRRSFDRSGRGNAIAPAQPELPKARSLTDELMDCVDRLGSEWREVDPRVWDHLRIYLPAHPPERAAQQEAQEAAPTVASAWAQAEALVDVAPVDEAIRNLLEDQTETNAVALIAAVLQFAPKETRQA